MTQGLYGLLTVLTLVLALVLVAVATRCTSHGWSAESLLRSAKKSAAPKSFFLKSANASPCRPTK